MRTAAEFNAFYVTPDPWRISRARFRDKVLRHRLSGVVAGRRVLELGCGEGHLTEAVFGNAKTITGIDISNVAIERARARNILNAIFENSDFLRTSFEDYDVIAAIECLYYLSPEDQETFFKKLRNEHRGRIFVLSGPIIGQNEHRRYFTHRGILETFAHHGMTVMGFYNLNIYRRSFAATIASVLTRLPLGYLLLDMLPESLIYQRCYVCRISDGPEAVPASSMTNNR